MIVAPARINVSSQLGREENVASLAMLHVTARMVGGHSGWLEVGCAVLLRVQDLASLASACGCARGDAE